MKLDVSLPPLPLLAVAETARAAQTLGFDGLWCSETQHDPFLPGALIAEHTSRIEFGTAVAIAFARSPATLAYTAWDLAQASQGRFILGLGTQVKAHIEKRFGMSWPDSVVGKLREQIGAIRAFWNAWQNDDKLDFRGNYYKLTLMTPFFNPGPIAFPEIPIYIAGVNRGLARLAGETGDGFLVHPFHSSAYLQEVLAPAMEEGLVQAERDRAQLTVSATVFTVTSPDQDLLARAQIGFYASTPSYRGVMAFHGWEAAAERLSQASRQGDWGALASLVNDEMLATFAVVCPEKELGRRLLERYAGLVDRIGLYLPFIAGEKDEFWGRLLYQIHSNSDQPTASST